MPPAASAAMRSYYYLYIQNIFIIILLRFWLRRLFMINGSVHRSKVISATFNAGTQQLFS